MARGLISLTSSDRFYNSRKCLNEVFAFRTHTSSYIYILSTLAGESQREGKAQEAQEIRQSQVKPERRSKKSATEPSGESPAADAVLQEASS